MQRQIVLDTETTGINIEDGHRIIEIGCVELLDRKLTDNHFHYYINPGRDIELGAISIHGITTDFLKDKPAFNDIAELFIEFIKDSEVIIHNAPFDLAFLDYELNLSQKTFKKVLEYCRVIDTLQIARGLHVGQRNSLDALCKRYGVDHSKRDLHGALLDAHLLAQVYLAMTGGQGSFFDTLNEKTTNNLGQLNNAQVRLSRQYHLVLLPANEAELTAHKSYLKQMQQNNECLWIEAK